MVVKEKKRRKITRVEDHNRGKGCTSSISHNFFIFPNVWLKLQEWKMEANCLWQLSAYLVDDFQRTVHSHQMTCAHKMVDYRASYRAVFVSFQSHWVLFLNSFGWNAHRTNHVPGPTRINKMINVYEIGQTRDIILKLLFSIDRLENTNPQVAAKNVLLIESKIFLFRISVAVSLFSVIVVYNKVLLNAFSIIWCTAIEKYM